MPEKPPEKPLALYIHWPFCKFKCPYCDFNSHVRESVPEALYVEALLREMETLALRVPGRQLTSLFFGGGTPSLLSPDTVNQLIEKACRLFEVCGEDALEITLEANPTSVEAMKFLGFREAGVNRVSLGVQSLEPAALAFLGRQHSPDEALQAVQLAAEYFPRFSFDLIYALPNQTVSAWKTELRAALQYAGRHLSLYQLTIEENTAFHHAYHHRKSFMLPVESLAADLYETTQEVMEAYGMPAYEISNHAASGEESRHNLAYWRGHEYIGIGPGAHGRLHLEDGWHATQCLKSPERWLEQVLQQAHGLEVNQRLSARERLEEYVMMRLRLRAPMALEGLPIRPDHPLFSMLQEEGLVQLHAGMLSLTARGALVQQAIVGELITAFEAGDDVGSVSGSPDA